MDRGMDWLIVRWTDGWADSWVDGWGWWMTIYGYDYLFMGYPSRGKTLRREREL